MRVGRRSSAPANAAGEAIFKNNCSSCHGAAGAGTPGAFPPLAANTDVTAADPKTIIHIVSYGLTGSITVNGHDRTTERCRTGRVNLKDDEIAAVISYIRSSWGNSASAVTTKDVDAVAK